MASSASANGENSGRRVRRNRRQQVVQAAIDVFAEKGFADASLQDVADRVGVLKGSLYHYIDSKEALLYQILSYSHEQGLAIRKRAEEFDGEPLDRLRFYLREHLEWYLNSVDRVGVYFSEWRFLTGERLELAREQRKSYDDFLKSLIVQVQECGQFDDTIDATIATKYFQGAFNSVPQWFKAEGRYSAQRVAEVFVDLTIRALSTVEALESKAK